MFRFPRIVGPAMAKEHLLRGELFDAETAQRMGLVNSLFEPSELLPAARRAAERIARNAPLSVEETRRVVEDTWGADDDQSWAISARAAKRILESEDAHEGRRAFVEKRAPVWKGR